MEVFPRDIKIMVIKMVSEGNACTLRHLFCVNKMWRRLVSDYVISCVIKTSFEYYLARRLNISLNKLEEWNAFENLSQQWKGTLLLPSFVMYLEASSYELSSSKVSHVKARVLFFQNQFLIDIKRMADNLDTIETAKEEIRDRLEKIEEHEYEIEHLREVTEEANEDIDELDKKWSLKRIKTE
jgi:hypothetical protein